MGSEMTGFPVRLNGRDQCAGRSRRVHHELNLIRQEFGIPVGRVDRGQEWHPFAIAAQAKHFCAKRRPLRPLRLADEQHLCLLRGLAALTPVTDMTGAYDVFPSGHAAPRAWNDMIEVEFGPWQPARAILTGIIVAGVDIETRKTHMALGHALVSSQQKHAWNPDHTAHDTDSLVADLQRQRTPAGEIEGTILFINGAGRTLIE